MGVGFTQMASKLLGRFYLIDDDGLVKPSSQREDESQRKLLMKQTIESFPGIEEQREVTSGIPMWKHVLDLLFVALTALAWLPMMCLIAIGIKLVSKGPLFFRQERIGYKNKPFTCLKFRTMKV